MPNEIMTKEKGDSRIKLIAIFFLATFIAAGWVWADTVYFNNGRSLKVTKAWRKDGFVHVQLEDGSFRAFANPVSHIEKESDTSANQPVLKIDTGSHHGKITGLFFTRNGQFVVSCSYDKTIRLWHVGSGQLVKTIRGNAGNGYEGSIMAAALSPDSQYLAVGGCFGQGCNMGPMSGETRAFGDIRVIDLQSGETVTRLKGNRQPVISLQFGNAGRHLISSTYGDPTIIWNVRTGEKIRVFHNVVKTYGPERIIVKRADIHSVAISPDGRRVIAGGNLWDMRSGDFIAYLKDFENDTWIWGSQPINKNFIDRLPEYERDIYRDPDTGLAYDKYWNHYQGRWCFIPDGQFILSRNRRNEILLWDASSGRLVRRIGNPPLHRDVDELLVSPDGKTVLISSWGGQFRMGSLRHLYRFGEHKPDLLLLRSFKHLPRGVTAISPDGRLAATGSRRDDRICLWDMESGIVIKTLGVGTRSGELLAANADELIYDIQVADGYADLRENQSLAQLRRAAVADAKHNALIAAEKRIQTLINEDLQSPPRELLREGRGNQIITLELVDFGIENNRRYHVRLKSKIGFRTLPRQAATNLRSEKIWGVGFSSDGRFIAWGKKVRRSNVHVDVALDQSFQLFDEDHRSALMLGAPLKGGGGWIRSRQTVGELSIQTDGNRLQVRHGKMPYQYIQTAINNILSYCLSPDGRWIVAGGDEGMIQAYTADTHEFICEFAGHSGNVWGLAISPDGRLMVSGSDDRTVKLWPLSGKQGRVEPVLSIFHGVDNEWIAWTPDGYYISSVNGDRYIGWQFNNGKDRSADFYSALQFERLLYRPDIIHSRLAAASGRAANGERKSITDAGIERLKPILPPKIRIIAPEFGDTVINADVTALQFSAEKNSINMLEYSVFVNGVPVVEFDERFLHGAERERFKREIRLPLFEKGNRVRIEVFNGKSLGVAHTLLYRSKEYSPNKQGDLYILSVGINSFARMPQFNLNYAAQDAESIAAAFSKMEGRNFKQVHAKILTDLSKLKPTKENILQALTFLRSASANDTVIVFIASHGFSDSAGNYYFVPSDAAFVEKRQQTLSGSTRGVMLGPSNFSAFISWEAFFEAMKSAAGKRLLIVDTCQAKRVRGTLDIHSLAKRSYSSSFALLVAAGDNETSQEYPPGKHGLFTYAIVNGLSEDADTNGDGRLTLQELYRFAADFVDRKKDHRLGPQTPLLVSPHGLSEMVLSRF